MQSAVFLWVLGGLCASVLKFLLGIDGLNIWLRLCFAIAVFPSMNPSGVQLRRYAIHGFACHSNTEVRIDHLYWLGLCSFSHL